MSYRMRELPLWIGNGTILHGIGEPPGPSEMQKLIDEAAYNQAKIDELNKKIYTQIVPLILISLAIIALFILHETGTIDFFGHWDAPAIQNVVHHLKV